MSNKIKRSIRLLTILASTRTSDSLKMLLTHMLRKRRLSAKMIYSYQLKQLKLQRCSWMSMRWRALSKRLKVLVHFLHQKSIMIP